LIEIFLIVSVGFSSLKTIFLKANLRIPFSKRQTSGSLSIFSGS
jgi:hypothetical protein